MFLPLGNMAELREPILEHIFALLPLKEAARMSLVSTTWKNAYNSLSCLNFGDYFFHKPLEKLVNVVHPILANRQQHKISVQKFTLQLPYTQGTCQVYNWIDTLVDCNIKELNLGVGTSSRSGYNELPEAIFNAKSLKVLKLNGFHIVLPSNGTIKYSSSLRELHLSDSYLDEEFIQTLCTSCCNLEVLIVKSFDGLASLQVTETLSKLKKAKFTCFNTQLQRINIRAPNLEELEIYSFEELMVVRITDCKALKCLCLTGMAMTQKCFEEIFSCLKYLEKFDLYRCDTLKTIKISSIELKRLKVYDCHNVIAVELDTPNLVRFWYECPSLPTLKLKASASLEAKITFASGGGGGGTPDSDHWYSKLMKFLGNFNHSMAIELTCKNDKALVIPKDMRENLLPPLYSTNCVQVNIRSRLINYSIVDILDSMFWFSPQLDTLSYCEPDIKTLKFSYEDALDEDEKPCCRSQPWECWRHKLKQVKMHNITCMEKKQELTNYFFTNADISEIIEVPPECIEFKY